jgi:hypothetical protein
MRVGVHPVLEKEADRMLRESLREVKSHKAKSDILTAWKMTDRRRKEVYVSSGTPDPSHRQGIFTRAISSRPQLNGRNGHRTTTVDSLSEFVDSQGWQEGYDL